MSRNGFVIGEGAGAVVLETEDHALRRGALIYAELAGWAYNNDAYHIVKPEPSGEVAANCIRKAMERAGVAPEEVDYINAHGTGSKSADKAELMALDLVFSGCRPAVSSVKGATGHVMGGGGLTEAIACIQSIREGVIPFNLNLKTPEADMDFVVGSSRRQKVDVAMSNAFGFGGQNSSLIFRKYEG